jgi:hypothetical protein
MCWRASWAFSQGQLAADGLINRQQTRRHMIADAAELFWPTCLSSTWGCRRVAAIDAVLLAALENGMLGNDSAEIEEADAIG